MLPHPSPAARSHARRALLLILLAAACRETTKPDPRVPTSIELVAPAPAAGTAGTALATAPTFVVKDQDGAIMGGVEVAVAVSTGGTLAGAPAKTAAGTPTSIGTWTLAPVAGANTLTITVEGLDRFVVTVQGVAGAPAKLVAQSGESATGTVGEPSMLLPRAKVTDAHDNPVAGVVVSVAVTGGGSSPATITSDVAGIATVASWTLGTTAGKQSLTMSIGAVTRDFMVEALAGAPASLVVLGGNAQAAAAGRGLAQPVVFSVADKYGNPVSDGGVSVTVAGGGSVTAPVTDEQGRTSVNWTLGKSVVPQVLQATAGSLSTTATATVRTEFAIDVRFAGPAMSAAQQAAFTGAGARLMGMITGDLEDVTTGGDLDLAEACGNADLPVVNEVVDDLVIYAIAKPIDGPGQVLGRAGPCLIRSTGSSLPVYGVMEFDSDDLARMEGDGTLQGVILHEMMHVTGVGVYWEFRGLLAGKDSSTVRFLGASAISECQAEGGLSVCGSSVPVENTGGDGTRNSHWRESIFDTEVMTGFENAPIVNGTALPLPVSRMTIGSLADIGYTINFGGADAWRVPGSSILGSARTARKAPWTEQLLRPRHRIGRDGRLTPVPPAR